MEILSARLVAKSPTARPQTLLIPLQLNSEFIVGRAHFLNGDNTIISRRHARFRVVAGARERLVVCNLSRINGMLVNFLPLPLDEDITLFDGDEIVLPIIATLI